ncbi:MAG TPA: amidase [Burkholderiaceae bacterium]|nr:amidase [Burkholderiaceae bacterium]
MPDSIASDLARSVNAGLATAEAAVRRYADAIEARDSTLQAFVTFDREQAIEAARAIDSLHAKGALAGVPVAVKDVIDTAQYETCYGSPIYRGHRPALDAGCVSLLRGAGAIVFGKTVTAELATFAPGPTRNPHALEHTPGGSSSGSAAAVAAALAPLALGTQTAGSVIRPASFCGVIGYKPSARLVPRSGVKVISDTLDEVGLFATSVDDVALLASVLALQSDWAMQAAQGRMAPPPKVGWTLTSRADQLDPAMRQAVVQAARWAREGGASAEEVAWPAPFELLFDAHRTIQLAETARSLAPEYAYRRSQLSAQLIDAIEEAHAFAGRRYFDAMQTGRRCAAKIESLFGDAEVLIAPSAIGEAPATLAHTGDPLFNRPWQLLGCPMIGLPFGRGPQGLPIGVSVIARPGQDALLIGAAAWLEQCWHRRPAE